MGRERSAFHPGQAFSRQQRPNTFTQTHLSLSFFACNKAADHTFGMADNQGRSPVDPKLAQPNGEMLEVDCVEI